MRLDSSLPLMPVCRAIAFILMTALLCTACGKEESPEERIRTFVKAGEEAAEARDAGDLGKLISEQYQDQHQRTKRDIVAVAARYLFINKNIHLLTRIDQLSFPQPELARCRIYVAMTGRNVSDLDSLLNMQADLYRFDVELAREDGAWKLVRAEWHRAGPEDFF